jgi:hypothetical protein
MSRQLMGNWYESFSQDAFYAPINQEERRAEPATRLLIGRPEAAVIGVHGTPNASVGRHNG